MNLRPFFCYYGGKWRCAPKYPKPVHGVIIEPFAGAAGYSLRYPDRDIHLFDLDPIIVGVWRYLINVSPREILNIPDVGYDETVDDLDICEEARWLVGFWLNKGGNSPRKRPSKWMRSGIRPGSFWGDKVRTTIASQITSIRHWKVCNRSYETIEDKIATWFIDPPYYQTGIHYKFSDIDYKDLATWCMSRSGQVITCENTGASWLPFVPWCDIKANPSKRGGRISREVIWYRVNAHGVSKEMTWPTEIQVLVDSRSQPKCAAGHRSLVFGCVCCRIRVLPSYSPDKKHSGLTAEAIAKLKSLGRLR